MGAKAKSDQVFRMESEITIAAAPEKVFEALTTGLDAWWPHRTKEDAKIVFEIKPGGMIYEDHGDGHFVLYGTLAGYRPPNLIVSLDSAGWGEGAYNSRNIERLEPDGKGGTVYKKTLILWGELSADLESMFEGGVPTLMKALKEYVEG